VLVHYSGWTKDGKMFDSSVERGEPSRLGVTQVIPGFSEALQSMVVGEKRRVWIPSNLAYGDDPRLAAAPAGQLTFDIELLEVQAIPTPPEVPVDVAVAPKSAKRTASGLAYLRLRPGIGNRHPTARSRVTVHYSGWTKDGKMFDSSVVREMPATFPLDGVIPGWTEGVQLMVEGEKARFWIPGRLAYGETKNTRGAPVGQLTFDIELISIE
jgi:peptidylprolyl isomerase